MVKRHLPAHLLLSSRNHSILFQPHVHIALLGTKGPFLPSKAMSSNHLHSGPGDSHYHKHPAPIKFQSIMICQGWVDGRNAAFLKACLIWWQYFMFRMVISTFILNSLVLRCFDILSFSLVFARRPKTMAKCTHFLVRYKGAPLYLARQCSPFAGQMDFESQFARISDSHTCMLINFRNDTPRPLKACVLGKSYCQKGFDVIFMVNSIQETLQYLGLKPILFDWALSPDSLRGLGILDNLIYMGSTKIPNFVLKSEGIYIFKVASEALKEIYDAMMVYHALNILQLAHPITLSCGICAEFIYDSPHDLRFLKQIIPTIDFETYLGKDLQFHVHLKDRCKTCVLLLKMVQDSINNTINNFFQFGFFIHLKQNSLDPEICQVQDDEAVLRRHKLEPSNHNFAGDHCRVFIGEGKLRVSAVASAYGTRFFQAERMNLAFVSGRRSTGDWKCWGGGYLGLERASEEGQRWTQGGCCREWKLMKAGCESSGEFKWWGRSRGCRSLGEGTCCREMSSIIYLEEKCRKAESQANQHITQGRPFRICLQIATAKSSEMEILLIDCRIYSLLVVLVFYSETKDYLNTTEKNSQSPTESFSYHTAGNVNFQNSRGRACFPWGKFTPILRKILHSSAWWLEGSDYAVRVVPWQEMEALGAKEEFSSRTGIHFSQAWVDGKFSMSSDEIASLGLSVFLRSYQPKQSCHPEELNIAFVCLSWLFYKVYSMTIMINKVLGIWKMTLRSPRAAKSNTKIWKYVLMCLGRFQCVLGQGFLLNISGPGVIQGGSHYNSSCGKQILREGISLMEWENFSLVECCWYLDKSAFLCLESLLLIQSVREQLKASLSIFWSFEISKISYLTATGSKSILKDLKTFIFPYYSTIYIYIYIYIYIRICSSLAYFPELRLSCYFCYHKVVDGVGFYPRLLYIYIYIYICCYVNLSLNSSKLPCYFLPDRIKW
ncbi:hypothetical protein VP01_628g4 [Puccinia sorghi]|uniref:Uncharacterized protein n=1 Tax=Puccinia sorghi TaxID=27349 RepID=A0A0L6UH56_9BASI|nr:hypothetical protein VP01_628g4 [Puccinia sorghi]